MVKMVKMKAQAQILNENVNKIPTFLFTKTIQIMVVLNLWNISKDLTKKINVS